MVHLVRGHAIGGWAVAPHAIAYFVASILLEEEGAMNNKLGIGISIALVIALMFTSLRELT
jgi:hypothetical protein